MSRPRLGAIDAALLAIAIAAAAAHLLGWPTGELQSAVAKSIPVLALALVALRGAPDRLPRAVAAGLLLSAGGDFALAFDRFLTGLGFFLVAHLAYLLGWTAPPRRGAALAAIVAYGLGGFVLWRLSPDLGPLLLPVAAYALVLATMLWRALARLVEPTADRASAVVGALGATLFVASDALLARDRFVAPVPDAHLRILALYWLGQTGVAFAARWARPRRSAL